MPATHATSELAPTKPVSDAERMLRLLRTAGSLGVHSHDLRRRGITGNPSQRAADLEAKGHSIERVRENRGRRPGTRYTLLVDVGKQHRADRKSRPAAPRFELEVPEP